MEPNYTHYEIDTCDIWLFEEYAFANEQVTQEHAQTLLTRIREIIIRNTKPIDISNGYGKDAKVTHRYLWNKIKMYGEASQSLEQQFTLGYFLARDGMYQYYYNIFLDPTWDNFEYWFALKLRQYAGRLSEIASFLAYQLEKNFQGGETDILHFLKLCLQQYSPELLSDKVTITVEEWMSDQLKQSATSEPKDSASSTEPETDTQKEETKSQRSNKGEEKRESEFNSFLLKAFDKDKLMFKKGNNPFLDVLIELKKSPKPFIAGKTTKDQFYAIFQNKKITPKNRIVWIGTNVELQWFVKILNYDLEVIEDLKNDVWVTTAKCFVKRNGSDYTDSQLRTAQGTKLDRQERLKKILSLLQ